MKIEERQRFLLILTIAVVALFAGDKLLFEPLGKLWTSRATDIKNLKKSVKDGKFLLSRENNIRKEWADMNTKTLTNNTSIAEQRVLNSVDDWSQQSGATVTGITPQWKKDSTNYMTLNCRVEATGDLGALSRFVYYVEQNSIALKLDSVQFSSHDNTGQTITLGMEASGLALTTTK